MLLGERQVAHRARRNGREEEQGVGNDWDDGQGYKRKVRGCWKSQLYREVQTANQHLNYTTYHDSSKKAERKRK